MHGKQHGAEGGDLWFSVCAYKEGRLLLHLVRSLLHLCENYLCFPCDIAAISMWRHLSQMRFRPWHGVFLSEHYLSSIEAAQEITQESLRMYYKHGVVRLVESNISTTDDLCHCMNLLDVTR